MYLPMPGFFLTRFPAGIASVVRPFSANSRKAFNPATPLEPVLDKSIIAPVIDEKMTISSRARDTATLSRLQPPA